MSTHRRACKLYFHLKPISTGLVTTVDWRVNNMRQTNLNQTPMAMPHFGVGLKTCISLSPGVPHWIDVRPNLVWSWVLFVSDVFQAIEAATVKVPPADYSKEISGTRSEQRVKMNRMRIRIAQRLKEAQNTNAMLTTFNELDMRWALYQSLLVFDDGDQCYKIRPSFYFL